MNFSTAEQPMRLNTLKEKTPLHLFIASIVLQNHLVIVGEVMVIAIL
jgi:hypothetical protein